MRHFRAVDIVPPGTKPIHSQNDLTPGKPYLFQVTAVTKDLTESSPAVTSAAVTPTVQWFDGTRVWFLVILIVFCGSVMAFIEVARREAFRSRCVRSRDWRPSMRPLAALRKWGVRVCSFRAFWI